MKIEMDENSSFTAIACTLIIVLCLVSMTGCHMDCKKFTTAVEAGLVQSSPPGQPTHWIKP